MQDRRRNLLILSLVLGLLAVSGIVVGTKDTKLGLDLQGGVELVYEAKPTPQAPKITQDALDRSIDVMRERVDNLGVAEPEIQRNGDKQISVGLPDVDDQEKAIRQVGQVAQLAFYDWEPNVIGPNGKTAPSDPNVTGGGAAGSAGALSLYDAVLRAKGRPAIKDGDNSRNGPSYYAVDKESRKVFFPFQKLKGGGIKEQLDANPIADTEAEALENVPPQDKKNATVYAVQPGTIIVRAEQNDDSTAVTDRWFVLNDDIALKGTDIKDPEQNLDQGAGGSGQPIVTFKFTDKGRKTWEDVTRRIAQRGQANLGIQPGANVQAAAGHFAIVLDDELVSVPYIDFKQNPDGIDARNGSQIQGGFTFQTAQDLADVLKTGALPVRLELISSSQVSATLGQEALDQGLLAGIAGFAIVALFLLVFYRILGVIAVVAMAVYGVYFFALIKLIPVVLTLPGIAGLILTLGVAADANIVIFERVKEEIRAGRSIAAGLAAGYRKGLTAIIDANVVTFMVAFILFILATAGVKGFALTLGLGVVVSLFTAVLATSAILGTMGKTRILSRPSALGAEKPHTTRTRIDFMGYAKWFFSASGVILLVCALALGSKGLNFGIDFESGTRIKAAFTQAGVTEDDVRDVLADNGQADAEIQRVTDDGPGRSKFQVSTENLRPDRVTNITNALEQKFGEARPPDTQSIGPTFGETVAEDAVKAIIASILVIAIYLMLRFEPKYAMPVIIAVMHDILITAGIYALIGQEVTTSTVAALLTILGFSLYDTIIVFDRIRENVPRMPRAAFSQIVNRSMSEVIVRSLATSFCAGLPVLALMLFGGDTLKDFAMALLIGTISGTYSSVFIAGPVLCAWKEREPVYVRRRRAVAEANGGIVPAYATAASGPIDVEPEERVRRRKSVTAPDVPGEQVSKAEFDEMVADLGLEEAEARTAVAEAEREEQPRAATRRTTARKPAAARRQDAEREAPKPEAAEPEPETPAAGTEPETPVDDGADALPEDLVMRDDPKKPKPRGGASKSRKRHGRK